VQKAMEAAGTPCPYKKNDHAEVDTRERTAEREDETRVAHNTYATVTEDAPAAAPAPAAEAPAPVYHFVPMQPIKD